MGRRTGLGPASMFLDCFTGRGFGNVPETKVLRSSGPGSNFKVVNERLIPSSFSGFFPVVMTCVDEPCPYIAPSLSRLADEDEEKGVKWFFGYLSS